MVKKRQRETLEELIARPWCYYCDRHFDDGRILHDHQKAKHFHCQVARCNRRLNTVGGLKVHMNQVHKEELDEVPNAVEGRTDVYPEIFGMEGVPEHLIAARHADLRDQYYRREAEHRARTGNPLPGSGTTHESTGVSKRRKTESKEDLKLRAAEAKARAAAAKAAKAAGGTPVNAPTPETMTNGPTTINTQSQTGVTPESVPAYMTPPAGPQVNPPGGLFQQPHRFSQAPLMSPYAQFPSHPGQLPSHPGQLPGHPAQLPGHPAQLPGHPAQLPGHPAQLPNHPAKLPIHPAQSMQPTRDSAIDAMIAEQQDFVHAQLHRPSSAVNGGEVVAAPKAKSTTENLLLSDNVVSWEEKRARAARYTKVS